MDTKLPLEWFEQLRLREQDARELLCEQRTRPTPYMSRLEHLRSLVQFARQQRQNVLEAAQ